MPQTRVIGRKILRYKQVTSTNDLAREFADAGEAEGLVISAQEQTAGRGRLARKWIAPPGTSIQLSILLRPQLAPGETFRLTQMAALALLSTLRDVLDLCPTLKWPNDVLLNQKKCAGILVETSLVGDQLVYAILGIGLNVNFSMQAEAPELSPRATTLADELRHPVDIDALERALLEKIDLYYARLLLGTLLLVEWRKHLSTLEQTIRVATSSGVEEGIAEDVDADGALLLRRRDGQLLKLYAGDVTLLPKDGSA